MTSPIRLVFIIILPIVCGQSSTPTISTVPMKMRINLYRNLPPDIHRLFNLTIHFPQFHKVNSALVVYLVDKANSSNNLIDTFVFQPGSTSRLTELYVGNYMTVPLCISFSSNRRIELHLRFNSTAQNRTLLIYYAEDYQPKITKPTATLIYESVISCSVSARPRINLTIGTTNVNEPAFLNDQSVWINCSAKSEHEPTWRNVILEGLDSFDILKHVVSNVTHSSSIYTSATIKNHRRMILCRSMDHYVSRMMLIYHHPVSVYTVPETSLWSSIPYNVSIRCAANGGYPPPIIMWQMRIGPHNASSYYKLIKGKTVLIMNEQAPPGSKWIFDCYARNSIPHSTFQGPMITIYSNVQELTIERRQLVVIVVPIIVIIIIALICILKTQCFKTDHKQKVGTFFLHVPQNKVRDNEERTFHEPAKANSTGDLSREGSSMTYSIEEGITNQSISVLDETLYLMNNVGSSRSLPADWLTTKNEEDIDFHHLH